VTEYNKPHVKPLVCGGGGLYCVVTDLTQQVIASVFFLFQFPGYTYGQLIY